MNVCELISQLKKLLIINAVEATCVSLPSYSSPLHGSEFCVYYRLDFGCLSKSFFFPGSYSLSWYCHPEEYLLML